MAALPRNMCTLGWHAICSPLARRPANLGASLCLHSESGEYLQRSIIHLYGYMHDQFAGGSRSIFHRPSCSPSFFAAKSERRTCACQGLTSSRYAVVIHPSCTELLVDSSIRIAAKATAYFPLIP
jgi:hypothetical protein